MSNDGWDELPEEAKEAIRNRPPVGTSVSRYADEAMFKAIPFKDGPVKPEVTLLYMTQDPLRVMAAASEMYQGRPVHDTELVSRETALDWFYSATKNVLQAPLEFIDIHLFIEGVTRAFTHQLVRQRTAVYVQESLRFAVKENAALEVVMPPSIAVLEDDDPARAIWEYAVQHAGIAYNQLVNAGIPAEDARGLLPTNIATRIHYKTNLRNLAEHSGLRLCSQAQHEWKQVWAEIIKAILNYGPEENRWQQKLICTLFKPICYQTGKCEFMAPTDRYCVIRERVEAHHRAGEEPDEWFDIDPHAPLHPDAARRPW